MEEIDKKVTRIHAIPNIHPAWLNAAWLASRLLEHPHPEAVYSGEESIALTHCHAVYSQLANQLEREDFGIIAGELITLRSLSPLSFSVLSSNNLSEGINKLIRFQSFVCDTLNLECISRKSDTKLRIHFDRNSISNIENRYLPDAILCWLIMLIQEFGAPNQIIRSIELPLTKQARLRYYNDVFDVPIYFDRESYALSLDLSKQTPPPHYLIDNRRIESILTTQMDICLDTGLTERISKLITNNFPKTYTQLTLADRLGVSIRTLQRKLDSEGTCYRELLESARKQAAQRYLQMNNSVLETSQKLGFRNSSNFSRAFKAWYGIAPSDYQKANCSY